TRFSRDWSSDVCSSDLYFYSPIRPDLLCLTASYGGFFTLILVCPDRLKEGAVPTTQNNADTPASRTGELRLASEADTLRLGQAQIGRASCRERVRSEAV